MKITDKVKTQFYGNLQSFAIVHWDGKFFLRETIALKIYRLSSLVQTSYGHAIRIFDYPDI